MTSIDRILADLDQTEVWQEELYKKLHANPELSMQESATATIIADKLSELGYQVQSIGGGVVGVLENGPGAVALMRADFDALPVREETGLPYASTVTQVDRDGVNQPVMHACGHDMHVTCALGAAALLAGARQEWSGTYVALFQPGEETAEGARAMVADDLASKIPHPDVALGQHVLTSPVSGHVATTDGPALSTALSIKITLFGRGSHGSMPHMSIDPVLMASALVQRLQGIVARELAPGTFGVVTVGSVQAGSKANIIPDTATLLLNIRAYSQEVREQLLAAIERIAKAETAASGALKEPLIETFDSYPATTNHREVYEKITAAFVKHFGPERVEHLDPVTASEDFSIVPDALGTPYCYWGFGGFTADQEVFPNHNPKFGPALQPTLRTGTEAALCAVGAYLALEK